MDLRIIIKALEEMKDAKPRSFLVSPGLSSVEKRFFETKRISVIDATFEEFLSEANRLIDPSKRKLGLAIRSDDIPIRDRFVVQNKEFSGLLLTLIERDVEYVHKGIKSNKIVPKAFYRGLISDWGPIEDQLDVKRTILDAVLYNDVLPGEGEDLQKFVLIKGHAGSGKTVFLKRLAWTIATDSNIDFLVLYAREVSSPSYEAILELFSRVKERIFLFFDRASDHGAEIKTILTRARQDRLPITVVSSERPSEWNEHAELEAIVTSTYELNYLDHSEIDQLIALLAKHKCLGHLTPLPVSQQREAFANHAGRQLLVALHEITEGARFTDIIYDEYKGIASPKAKLLYRTVCVLHRVGVRTRAGLISRLHGIPFEEFKSELFKPLEYIVFARKLNVTNDFSYESRHPIIAEIVFERSLIDQEERFEEYKRIVSNLDTGYAADREAFHKLMNARHLSKVFNSTELVRDLYDEARVQCHDDAGLLQQAAIYEMHSKEGDLDFAARLLERAKEKAPYNKGIEHSIAELQLSRSQRSTLPVERHKLRNEALTIANRLAACDHSPYSSHTQVKIKLAELRDTIAEGNETAIQEGVKILEKDFQKLHQQYPGEPMLLSAEATFSQLIGNSPKAIHSLQSAFAKSHRNTYIASRLSRALANSGHSDEALAVLQEGISANPNDKDLHYERANLLLRLDSDDITSLKYNLRNSFVEGDERFDAQFWYGATLYREGEFKEALAIFNRLKNANLDNRLRHLLRGRIRSGSKDLRFTGVVRTVGYTHCYVERDGFGDSLYSKADFSPTVDWSRIARFTRVSFFISFNFLGPVAETVLVE